jgi:hypothetical protein
VSLITFKKFIIPISIDISIKTSICMHWAGLSEF